MIKKSETLKGAADKLVKSIRRNDQFSSSCLTHYNSMCGI